MRKHLSQILRVLYILVLLAMPVTVHITKELYWSVADPAQSFNTDEVCRYFAVPFLIAAALISLLLQHLDTHRRQPDRTNNDCWVTQAFWLLKLILWVGAAIYIIFKFLTSKHTWDLNWQWCLHAFQFITPALTLHLIELVWKWYPVIAEEMISERNILIRILFAGKSVLFGGISLRKTLAEKIIYTIRTCYWFFVVVCIIVKLPGYILSSFALTEVTLWNAFCGLGMCLINEYEYIALAGLRLIDLVYAAKAGCSDTQ